MARTKTQMSQRNGGKRHERVRPKRTYLRKASDNYPVGTVVEALMTDENWPHYKDVFHTARVLSKDAEKAEYLCRCLAFNDGEIDFFHEPERMIRYDADLSLKKSPVVFDVINFRMRNRSVKVPAGCGPVDGFNSSDGVWVRGVVMVVTNDYVVVAHYDWNSNTRKPIYTQVSLDDLRRDPLNIEDYPLSFDF